MKGSAGAPRKSCDDSLARQAEVRPGGIVTVLALGEETGATRLDPTPSNYRVNIYIYIYIYIHTYILDV